MLYSITRMAKVQQDRISSCRILRDAGSVFSDKESDANTFSPTAVYGYRRRMQLSLLVVVELP